MARSAILSELNQAYPFMASATTNATSTPPRPNSEPTSRTSALIAPSSRAVLSPFRWRCTDVVLPGTGPSVLVVGLPAQWNERRPDGVPGVQRGVISAGQTRVSRNEELTSNASTRNDPGTGSHMTSSDTTAREVVSRDRVVIRFAGDSGDGMQLTGDRFTSETASFGNDLSTLPNFPAEIRAPAGTLPGVSSFQLHFADHDILTPGDPPNVLVAMNPAALKANITDLPRGAEIIVNTDEFTKRAMQKVGYDANPLEDGSLDGYSLHPVPLTTLTVEALKDFDLSRKEAERSKNMFALGLLSWMYHRPTEGTEKFLRTKFARKPEIAEANLAAFRAGWNFGETTEDFAVSYEIAPATKAFPVGTYRNISGNLALSYGLVAASRQADLPLFLGSYPITPASDILHELSKHKNFGVRTFQAEDEIAGIGAALGAAFGGSLAVTTTSGPGVALKSETIGLAVSLEL